MRRSFQHVIRDAQSAPLLASKKGGGIFIMDITGHQNESRWGPSKAKKADFDKFKYWDTKSREKWDYDKIDNEININSVGKKEKI